MIELAVVLVVVAAIYFFAPSDSPLLSTDKHSSGSTTLKVPEDSTLKRHFLATLRAKIESELHPRPSDAVLKRHYDSLIVSEMEKRLGTCIA